MAETDAVVPALEGRDITKTYGHVLALDAASISIMPREILALVGDNGAGKSTLVKALCGAVRFETGSLFYGGQAIDSTSVRVAQGAGIEVVYQDLALAPDLDISQNLFLGREMRCTGAAGRLGGTRRKLMRERSQQTLQQLGLIDFPSLGTPVRELSGGQQQAVAVARAIMWATSVVAMDEPTAALGVRQTGIVYNTILSAVERGLSILVISHDIPKMLTVAHRVAVMRHGRVVTVLESARTSMTEVVGIMLGQQ